MIFLFLFFSIYWRCFVVVCCEMLLFFCCCCLAYMFVYVVGVLLTFFCFLLLYFISFYLFHPTRTANVFFLFSLWYLVCVVVEKIDLIRSIILSTYYAKKKMFLLQHAFYCSRIGHELLGNNTVFGVCLFFYINALEFCTYFSPFCSGEFVSFKSNMVFLSFLYLSKHHQSTLSCKSNKITSKIKRKITTNKVTKVNGSNKIKKTNHMFSCKKMKFISILFALQFVNQLKT